ncbi:MAG TPA: ABC transporter substrate-binding protein [Vineibacter sp.]|nr:ABC transporter substrate-binding protein [Vineibacter sp.]
MIGWIPAATLATAGLAVAQPARKVRRLGILGNSATDDVIGPQPRAPSISAFLLRLRELGYVYGEHFVTEARGSEGHPERFDALAAELVRLQVDVIVAPGTAMPALVKATSTIPIIMAAASDPVGGGYVQGLAQPGRNVTGLSLQSIETTGKRLELLKELVPGPAPVAVLWDRGSLPYLRAAEAAAQTQRWTLLPIEIRDPDQLDSLLQAAVGAGAGSLLVCASATLFAQRRRIAALAARNRLPDMYELQPYVEAGGLASYGPDLTDIWRRAADFVDKIWKGAKPGDLPVEQPTKFELVINLQTAATLGLTVPQSILLRADEVIQ